jgi:hypothetical protein
MTSTIEIGRDWDDSGPEFIECPMCHANGVCTACKGCGRSGYFLRVPPRTAPPCRRSVGSGKCPRCSGKGAVLAFEPYIAVKTSSTRPTSISMAAFTGALWRFIDIPHKILWRSFEPQRGWVAWRIRKHRRENGGECALFGQIVGYVWVRSNESRIQFDVRGQLSSRPL